MALANTPSHPYLLYAISNRPPGSSGSGSGSGGSHSRDPIQVICPFNGSNLTGAHPLRVPASSTAARGGVFGVRCMIPVTLTNTLGFGGDDANSTVFVGHGGSGDAKGMESGKDDHAFLSMAVSPDGRFIVAGSTNGTCYLWDWTSGEDNLVRVFKAHYRPVTCVAFDKDDGATLFTAGEDGVVNAWCLLDLVDQDCPSGSAIHPFHTWSEHHLSVTSLCVLPGSGCGSTRLVSSSLDRNLIIMELGSSDSNSSSLGGNSGARTLARMCLPSEHAIQKSLNGLGTSVAVDEHHNWAEDHNNKGKKRARGDFESILSGNHLSLASAATGLASDNSKYISELKGHVKAVVSLALLDPTDLATFMKFATLGFYADAGSGTATSYAPVTTIVAVPKSSLTGNALTMAPSRFSTGRKVNAFDIATSHIMNFNHIKKARTSNATGVDGEDEKLIEITRLRKELQESKALVERWQTVNNQLVAKLKNRGS
ncbi:WD40 repeat domain-containing protein [Skeletonema marinoi]|uniref:WD40 repeat domain-containing protein n=1 Tax=Skeletonema marinoi TaxID=267567 RepID=A0AAD8YEB3_9STRA|nr:WD40 repeat domain-containing protein [Skeletonema marinoi]